LGLNYGEDESVSVIDIFVMKTMCLFYLV
jgi:hypothetical protein